MKWGMGMGKSWRGWGMSVEYFWVNTKIKKWKGNDRKWQTNNNKENWVCPFLFPLIITPNQTAPKCILLQHQISLTTTPNLSIYTIY